MKNKPIYDVIIIGAGAAGFTAGIYTCRARHKSLMIGNIQVSSQVVLTDRIENYPGFPEGIGGFELLSKFKKQAQNFGLKLAEDTIHKIEVSDARLFPEELASNRVFEISGDNGSYHCLAVIIATGANFKKLGIKGEEELTGRGVSYCAVCDAALFRDKDIVVIGGGDTAIQEALFLTRFGKKVFLVHRRDRLRATNILQEKAAANRKIEIVWNSEVTEILGADKVEGIKLVNNKTVQTSQIPCEGVFIFVGYVPNTAFLKGLVELDRGGYVITNDTMKTSCPGVFSCGDCRSKLLRQVVTACGDGATAAMSARHYIEKLKGTTYL